MSSTARCLALAALLASGGLAQLGCRACYTPYDYCGPVLDGTCDNGCGPCTGWEMPCGDAPCGEAACGQGACGQAPCNTGCPTPCCDSSRRSGSVLSYFTTASAEPVAEPSLLDASTQIAEAPPEPGGPIVK